MTDLTSAEWDDHNEYDECPTCGGEGVIFNCFDGFCEDADWGCDDCTRACPDCSPNQVRDTGDELGQVLADALGQCLKPEKSDT